MKGQESKLGALLVREGITTQTQLNHALQVQKEQEERQSLGEILVDLGFVTRRKLRNAVERHGRRALFGEVLVMNGTISREQLEEALTEQKVGGQALGEILVEKGVLTDEQLAQALSRQLDIPYMVPRLTLVDMKLFGRLPQGFVQLHSVIPFMEADGVATVLVADPTDLLVIHTLEDTFGSNLELAICSKSRIDRAIQALLRQKRFDAETERAVSSAEGERILRPALVIEGEREPHLTEDNRAVEVLDSLICDALAEGASDIHIEPQRDRVRVRHRIDGVLLFRTEFPLSLSAPLATRAKVLAKLDISTMRMQQEGRILAHVNGREADLRVTISPSIFGESLSIRIFAKDTGLMDIEDLGMVPAILSRYRRLVEQKSGLVLFVGPTGSGKTTSLYATLNYLNDGSRKIVTVESPVEFPMDGTVQNNLPTYEAGDVTRTLLSALHQDPDVIGLGEITSDETAGALLESGLMGHKVFSTQHAEDGASALVRLGHVRGATSFVISCSLVIIAQRLVRTVCANCSEVYVPPQELVEELQVKDFDRDDVDFRAGTGCTECLGTGYRGRTAMFEMLEIGSEMRSFLLDRPSAREIRQVMAKRADFIPLRRAGFLKAVQGITTLEEVLRVAPTVEVDVMETQQMTMAELCRRAGLSFGKYSGRFGYDMARTPPEKEGL